MDMDINEFLTGSIHKTLVVVRRKVSNVFGLRIESAGLAEEVPGVGFVNDEMCVIIAALRPWVGTENQPLPGGVYTSFAREPADTTSCGDNDAILHLAALFNPGSCQIE
jgi:hypothetical protein